MMLLFPGPRFAKPLLLENQGMMLLFPYPRIAKPLQNQGLMLLFPCPRIAKSFMISTALTPSASPSSNSSEPPKTLSTSMVHYLVNSLGFSREEAISAVSAAAASSNYKVKNHRKSKANLVVDLLKSCGLDDYQVKDVVSSIPEILLCNAKMLEPKIRVLLDHGLSGSDIVKILKSNRHFINVRLHGQIIPSVDFFKKLLGSDENLVHSIISSIIHSRWHSSEKTKRMSANLSLLQNYGLSNERIKALVAGRYILHQKPEWFQDKLQYAEVDLGISRDSPMFLHGLRVVFALSKSTVNRKIRVFKRFGWSDSEVYTLIRAQPFCLTRSEPDLEIKLNLFMKELGYTPTKLITYAVILTLSLEKRVIPRYEILKILKERKLVREKPALSSLLRYTEKQFLRFVQRFEHHVPNLTEIYVTSVKNGTKTD